MRFLRAFAAVVVEAWRQLEDRHPGADRRLLASSERLLYAVALVIEANLRRLAEANDVV